MQKEPGALAATARPQNTKPPQITVSLWQSCLLTQAVRIHPNMQPMWMTQRTLISHQTLPLQQHTILRHSHNRMVQNT